MGERAADRSEVRSALEAATRQTAAQISALTRDFQGVVEAATDVATDDEHDPEGATIGFERAQLSGLLEAARRRLADLEEAAERLAQGSYGVCQGCGGDIPAERLAARPAATSCVSCAATTSRSITR